MNDIFIRRSIRTFLEKPIEPEKIERILRAGMQSPSAKNRQPWEFAVIQDSAEKEAISKMAPNAALAKNAAQLIIVCCNINAIPEEDRPYKWWIEDLSACTENILLQIVAEGLGGVWLGFYPKEERIKPLAHFLNLPEHMIPFSVVALGYSNVQNTFVDRFDAKRIHYGIFPSN